MEYRISKFVRFAFAAIMFMLVAGFVVMSLWNWLIPALFGGPFISLPQALGLLLLSRIFFGGIGGGKWGHKGHMRRHWRKKWKAKMAGMTEEEKEQFRSKFKGHDGKCGWSRWREDREVHEPEGVDEKADSKEDSEDGN